MKFEQLIDLLNLKPHPEGGYYRETYRGLEKIAAGALPPRYGGERNTCTAIFYLLTPDTFSVMHRLASDEVFHFYLGDAVEMLLLRPDKRSEKAVLGQDIENGQRLQLVVPQGWWQGCRLISGGHYALLGCTVAPGFDFADFSEGTRAQLQADYPEASGLIAQLTRR